MRVVCISLLLCGLGVASFAQVPLGDIARQQRAGKKPATRVITNDDLTSRTTNNNGAVSTVGSAPDTATAKESDKKESDQGDTASEKSEKAVRDEYATQKKAIEKLTTDMEKIQREYQEQNTALYGDLGTRLRNEQQWADKNQKYQKDLADKQKELDAAQEKLDAIREKARRAGLNPSQFED